MTLTKEQAMFTSDTAKYKIIVSALHAYNLTM